MSDVRSNGLWYDQLQVALGVRMAKQIKSRRGRPQKTEVQLITPRILEAATDVFLAQGYDNANMSEVANLGGCSKRTLYLRFPSKLDLFSACMKHFVETRLEGVRLSVNPQDALERQLEVVARTLREYATSEKVFSLHRLLVRDTHSFPELQAVLQKSAWDLANRFVKELLRQSFPHIPDDDLSMLADQFLAITALRPLHHGVIGGPIPADPPAKLVQLFLHGCCGFATRPGDPS